MSHLALRRVLDLDLVRSASCRVDRKDPRLVQTCLHSSQRINILVIEPDNGLEELAHALRVFDAVRKVREHRDVRDTKVPDHVDLVHRNPGVHEEREEVVVQAILAGERWSACGQSQSSHDEEQVDEHGKLVEEVEGNAS